MVKTARRFLAIAAHADDFELFASGTCQLGEVVVIVLCEPDAKRRTEARHAAELLGYQLHWWGLEDGCLFQRNFRTWVANSITAQTPDVILTHDPWKPYQLHPDHREVGIQVTDSITLLRIHTTRVPEEIWYWNTDAPNLGISVDVEKKHAALACFQSQPILQRALSPSKEFFHQVVLEEEFG